LARWHENHVKQNFSHHFDRSLRLPASIDARDIVDIRGDCVVRLTLTDPIASIRAHVSLSGGVFLRRDRGCFVRHPGVRRVFHRAHG